VKRTNTGDVGNRAGNMIARVTLSKTNDDPKVQEVDVEILKGEKKTGFERFQNYGFTGHAKVEEGDTAAEGIIVFLGGNRSHGVIIQMDDRRYRLKGLKEGEVAVYDDLGQKVHLTRDGVLVKTSKKVDVDATGEVTIKSAAKVTLQAPTIVLDGNVFLGGAGATRPLALQGSVDSDGDTEVGNLATKVKAI
jgi:phage baseplate assembly protein V